MQRECVVFHMQYFIFFKHRFQTKTITQEVPQKETERTLDLALKLRHKLNDMKEIIIVPMPKNHFFYFIDGVIITP